MIAKIGHGTNLMGALMYNFQKVDAGKGSVLDTQNICQATDGGFTLALSYRSFAPYLLANRNTEKPSLHISINPDPKDNVDDNTYRSMAEDYMLEMGYGHQPYIVFKHTDIERTHIHIVSINVDEYGKKIRDTFEQRRSMQACRGLERKYGLTAPAHREDVVNEALFKPVDPTKENIKGQIASVVRYLPHYYHYQNLGTYNALLSLFNITAQEVTGEINGTPRQGLVYFALDSQGNKASHPFKASLFGKHAGHTAMLAKFEKSQDILKNELLKSTLSTVIEVAMHSSKRESDFKLQLKEQGINVVFRRNSEGRIYGVTFIDHTSKSVWNGSQLGKGLSANVFEQRWNTGTIPLTTNNNKDLQGNEVDSRDKFEVEPAKIANPFARTDGEIIGNAFEGIMDIVLPTDQAEDFQEQAFAHQMKKRKKKNK